MVTGCMNPSHYILTENASDSGIAAVIRERADMMLGPAGLIQKQHMMGVLPAGARREN